MASVDELTELMFWSPLLLAFLIGIVVALMRYRRHPRVSLLTMLACVGLMLMFGVMPFVDRFLSDFMSFAFGAQNAFRVLFFVNSCLIAAMFLLLILAVFSGRNKPVGIRGPDGQYLPPDFLKPGERK